MPFKIQNPSRIRMSMSHPFSHSSRASLPEMKMRQVGDFNMSNFGSRIVIDDDYMEKEIGQNKTYKRKDVQISDEAWHGNKFNRDKPFFSKVIKGGG